MARTQAEWNAIFDKANAEAERQLEEYRKPRAQKQAPTAEAPATEKQVAFINKLMHRDPAYASNFVTDPTRLTMRQASQVIDNLLAGA